VEIGEFLQYTLVVRNIHDAPAINVRVRDLLPPGLRYRAGSLRVRMATAPGTPPVVVPLSSAPPPAAAPSAPRPAGRPGLAPAMAGRWSSRSATWRPVGRSWPPSWPRWGRAPSARPC